MLEPVRFFIVQLVTILALLFVISSGIGFLRTYISQQRIKELLVMREGLNGHFVASLLGAITPFSPRDSIRLFSNFLNTGVPLGICLSFLIASPIINEYIVILLIIFFGLKTTIIYLLLGVIVAILIGIPIPGTGAALIPVAVALFEKGIPLGTALGFLIAVVGLSLPKAFKLRKILEKKLIIYFFIVLGISTIVLSYIINFIVSI
jgi:uncharacterized membrane protein YraQ (UPF0718 family)